MTAMMMHSSPGFLSNREIHVWYIAVARLRLDLGSLWGALPRQEQVQADRFVFTRDREMYVASHYALRELLAVYLQVSPQEVEIRRTYYGKPYVAGAGIGFNLSHSGGAALVAIARGREVGVDIEQGRTGTDAMRRLERFFSQAERTEISDLPAPCRTAAFHRCWTRKEAYLKAVGCGLSVPLHSFSVPVAEACRHAIAGPDGGQWTLDTIAGLIYPAAVAYSGRDCNIQIFEFGSAQHDRGWNIPRFGSEQVAGANPERIRGTVICDRGDVLDPSPA